MTGRKNNVGRARSKSPDNLLVSIDDRLDEMQQQKSRCGEEICCKHGKLCAIGRRTLSSTASITDNATEEQATTGYETIKISKLENPPESFTRRRPISAEIYNNNNNESGNDSSAMKQQSYVMFRCKYPSDLSSIATPTSMKSNSRDSTDGVYENIESLNKSQKLSVSSTATARDSSGTLRSKDDGRRYRRRKETLPSAQEIYLGAMARRDAEKHVQRNTHFRLYHRIPSNASTNIDYLKDHITLFIVYKSSQGRHHHYPIYRRHGPSGGKQYYIDCDKNERVVFSTLDALVNYYSVYVCFDVHEETADIFPIPSKYKNRAARSIPRDDDGETSAHESKQRKLRQKREKSEDAIYY